MMANSFRLTLFLALSILECEITAQSGFNRNYDFESDKGAAFVNLTLLDNAIIGYGLIINNDFPFQQGINLSSLDTFGNVNYAAPFYDTQGYHYIAENNYDIRVTNDQGIICTGVVFGKKTSYLLKTDSYFEPILWNEMTDSINKTTHTQRIIEISDGYIIVGFKQRPNFRLDIYATRTDAAGNQLWEYYYGDYEEEEDISSSIWKVSDSLIAIGGIITDNNPLAYEFFRSRILTINLEGEVVSDWQGDDVAQEAVLHGLHPTEDKGWIYATAEYLGLDSFDSPRFQQRLVRLDSVGNYLWSNPVGETTWNTNLIWDIKPSGDGNWIGVGRLAPAGANYVGGWLFKFDNAGTVLWSRVDTASIAGGDAEEHVLCGLSVLPSGSIVACGYFKNYAETPIKSYAWLIKTDANGCIDSTDCAVTGVTEPWTNGDSQVLYLYPNPATDMLYLSLPGYTKNEVRYSITDPTGRKVAEGVSPVFREQVSMVVEDLVEGMYFISIMEDGTDIRSLKFVKSSGE